jgi:hypothetical protein
MAVMQHQTNILGARDKAKINTVSDLIAGRLIGLGRGSGSYSIEAIDPAFWIGAKIDGDSASRESTKLIEIHIASPDSIPSLKARSHPGSGRPSKADVIRAAIADHAKTDPGLDRPRLERFRRYGEFISAQGFNPRKDSGFGEKTFEKYELEYRKKFRQLRPIYLYRLNRLVSVYAVGILGDSLCINIVAGELSCLERSRSSVI